MNSAEKDHIEKVVDAFICILFPPKKPKKKFFIKKPIR
jgi:hypothetical protein